MSALVWDAALARYRYATTGTVVPLVRIWATVDRAVAPVRDAMARLTHAWLAGALPVEEWQRSMQRQIQLLHCAAIATACGGFGQMRDAHWAYVDGVVRGHYRLLDRLATAGAADDRPADDALLARAVVHADAARASYENTRVWLAARAGATEERRVRHRDDTCPTCLAEAARGWQPIGTAPLLTDSECLTGCRCRKETR
jgi:hypothetical protein